MTIENNPALGLTNAVTTAGGSTPTPSDRFVPGAIIAGRYRLVAMLGRGGMGEVYRADDLTLDQPVALKFLPADVAADAARLSAFHNELRVARQVSHKNVCRLHDLGEADGRRFLTMEYVDGEDLGSLLRRVGRVPQERGLQMARQLCAGTAAAHERGVIHRDLKPANVMIDGDGNVRITDFGIATAAGQRSDVVAGTPQYMAPEQLAGRPASTGSDIYSLGLILFELFTGRRAIESRTLAELREFHQSGRVATPTTIVQDLDPALERVILRCLDRDPARRPASALAVAASLPGGDLLAAALAAGETPSPELLAAAGEVEALSVRRGITLVASVVLGLLAFAVISSRTSIPGRVPLDEPPAVLVDRAETILSSLGHPIVSGDQAYDFVRDYDYTRWLIQTRPSAERWRIVAEGNPSAVLFWYRTAPNNLQPESDTRVTMTDPPIAETDMRLVVLDSRGRLREFRAVPPQHDAGGDTAVDPPWSRAFEAAGLEMSSFSPATPEWTPRDYADARAAWEGVLPGQSAASVRVEASAYKGRLVSFAMIGPWTRPTLMDARRRSRLDRVIEGAATLVVCALLAVAVLLARRNLRADRADRKGAARLAAGMATIGFLAWLFGAHHDLSVEAEYDSLFRAGGEIALVTSLIWVMYLALEPYVRRFWPDSLLGWSRLLSGRLRDPRVGRDLLVGAVFGVVVSLIAVARATIIPWLGYRAPSPTFGDNVGVLAGAGPLVSTWMLSLLGAVQGALIAVLLVVLVRLILRRTWLSALVSALLLSMPFLNEAGTTSTNLVFLFVLASGAVLTFVVFRSGLLALAVALLLDILARNIPIMPSMSHWAAGPGNWTLALLVGVACFGYYASRGGQPLFGTILKG